MTGKKDPQIISYFRKHKNSTSVLFLVLFHQMIGNGIPSLRTGDLLSELLKNRVGVIFGNNRSERFTELRFQILQYDS